jgi:hypothetical protein
MHAFPCPSHRLSDQVTYDLYKKYGEFRLLDTPICEYSFLVRPPAARSIRPPHCSLSVRRGWVLALR